MTAPRLVLRAEAGAGRGAGHVARAVALGQAWRDLGLPAVLVADPVPKMWRRRCLDAGMTVISPGQFDSEAGPESGWAVLDGYGFGADEQAQWRARCGRLLVVDDHAAAGTWTADLVLDQNLGAEADAYGPAATRPDLLLGPRYALLRREFRAERLPPGVDGARPLQVALAAGGEPRAEVAAWSDRLAGELTARGLDVVRLEGVADMVPALAETDLAVSAAGGTAWELCGLGIPTVLVAVAANQVPVAARLARAGAARAVLPPEPVDSPADSVVALVALGDVVEVVTDLVGHPETRAELAQRGRALVDGLGAVRVATRLRAELLELRPVVADDARTLWEWANDPGTRAQSFSDAPIPWDAHRTWLADRLAHPSAALYLAHDPQGLVGQVRFAPLDRASAPNDAEGPWSEIGVVVAPERRGQHLAGALIDAGVRRAARDLGSDGSRSVLARIKVTNQASRRSFAAADFDLAADQVGLGQGWVQYTRHLHEPER
jgi:UDP-2,4-diacetamido-2,4,6-trideoxy-beta-L-altropyranose hydrolase